MEVPGSAIMMQWLFSSEPGHGKVKELLPNQVFMVVDKTHHKGFDMYKIVCTSGIGWLPLAPGGYLQEKL